MVDKETAFEFNALVPELSATDFLASLKFYTEGLGFKVEYDRLAEKFAFLSCEGAQLMLVQAENAWITGDLEPPLGRGVNFEMARKDLSSILSSLAAIGHGLYQEPADVWRDVGGIQTGQREFLVQDLDGYLLRFCQDLGSK